MNPQNGGAFSTFELQISTIHFNVKHQHYRTDSGILYQEPSQNILNVSDIGNPRLDDPIIFPHNLSQLR
jgi:hypothetical protein